MAVDTGSVTTTILTALAGIGAGGYAVWRRLKSDNLTDSTDQKSQRLIDNLERQLQREIETKEGLGKVIDRLAAERNEAVQKLGKLEGVVHALEKEVQHMTEELHSLEKENAQLTSQIMNMSAALDEVRTQVGAMVALNNQLLDQLKKREAERSGEQ